MTNKNNLKKRINYINKQPWWNLRIYFGSSKFKVFSGALNYLIMNYFEDVWQIIIQFLLI